MSGVTAVHVHAPHEYYSRVDRKLDRVREDCHGLYSSPDALQTICDATAFLATGKFRVDRCVSRSMNHLNKLIPVKSVTTMPCGRLVKFYPFVERRQRLSSDNKTLIVESLTSVNGTVLGNCAFYSRQYFIQY